MFFLGICLHSLLQIVEAWKWKKLLQAFYSVLSLQFIAEKLQNCFLKFLQLSKNFRAHYQVGFISPQNMIVYWTSSSMNMRYEYLEKHAKEMQISWMMVFINILCSQLNCPTDSSQFFSLNLCKLIEKR